MVSDILRSTLKKFTKEELFSHVQKWSFFRNLDASIDEVVTTSDKNEIVSQIVKFSVKKGVSSQDVGDLDLLYVHSHSKAKTWTVYKLKKLLGNPKEKNVVVAEEFQVVLETTLDNFFDVDVNLLQFKDAFWVRIYIHESKSGFAQRNAVYMVYYPHTSYLLLTAVKASQRDGLLQSLMVAIGGTELNQIKLSGHCVTSLLQLALNKESQGSFSQYRLNQIDSNPLSVKQRKRKDYDKDEEESDVHQENQQQKRQRTAILLDIFGPNEQPQLEKVEYKLDTMFRGYRYAPAMREHTEPFHCRAKFEGANVLEGMRNLAKAGILDVKMPSHVKNLPSLGKNQLTLSEKEHT